MNLYDFYKKESTESSFGILTMAIIAGISNSIVLFIIILYIGDASNSEHSTKFFILFVIATMIFVVSKKFATTRATAFIEALIKKIRVRIVNKVRKSELSFMEGLDDAYIFTKLTQETDFISQATNVVISSCQNVLAVTFSLIFLLYLSTFSFIFTIVTLCAGVIIFISYKKIINKLLHESSKEEAKLFDYLSQILSGFKELKLNNKKSDDLFDHFEKVADTTENLKVKTGIHFSNDMIYSQAFVMGLIAAIAFLLPLFTTLTNEENVKIVMVVIFMIGPLELTINSVPAFTKGNLAIDSLYKFEEELDRGSAVFNDIEETIEIDTFKDFQLDEITFSYKDKEGKNSFRLGPIDLSVKKGDLIFLVGGNGSGKSTLLKLLTGLYYPEYGNIILNGNLVTIPEYQAYRELFSIIFCDFHLFDKLYGLKNIDKKHVNNLIKLMGLSKKTQYSNGKFSNTSLSTGQRKRLAMIVSFLDDKPIYIFDEVAADQDPEFRKYFYEVILKDLRDKGKTVIAATHDDKYFNIADRIIKMDYGKMSHV